MPEKNHWIKRFLNWVAPQNVEYGIVLHKGKNRILIMGIISFFVYSTILSRLLLVGGFPRQEHLQKKRIQTSLQGTTRANIYDRNSKLVASMLQTKGLFVNPQKVKNPELLVQQLSEILTDMKPEKIYKKITYKAKNSKTKARFVWLNRRLTPQQQYDINALGDVSLDFIDAQTRIYPNGSLLSHTLGYVNVDNKGIGLSLIHI